MLTLSHVHGALVAAGALAAGALATGGLLLILFLALIGAVAVLLIARLITR